MREVDPRIFAEALHEYANAPYGHKTEVRDKWCALLGISHAKFHRDVKRGSRSETRKQRRDAGKRQDPRVDEWAGIIVRVMGFVPKTVRRPTVKLGLKKALKNNMLPPEAADVPLATYYRVIRDKGLLERAQRVVRFEASRPMEMWQMDASGSEHIYVARKDPNGEPVLKLRATKGNYKNKPHDGLKVWYYGMVDDHSGYWLARATVALGESSADNLAFLKWCACKKDDERIPFYGLPEKVYMDNGALARAHATREFFKRVDVELQTHEANSPEDTGKIEVRWKPLWRNFEMDLLMDPHWNKVEMTIGELNRRLVNFIAEENQRRHRHLNCTRTEAWLSVIRNGGVVEISPEAWDTVFVTSKVTIDRAGWFSFDGKDYEVREIHNCKARAYKGVLNGEVIVKDLRTNRTFDAREARYLKAGEHRSGKKQEWEKVREESRAMKELFAPGEFKGAYEDAVDGPVSYIPVRSSGRNVDTSFNSIDPHSEKDAASAIPAEVDAASVPRSIVAETIPLTRFFKMLKDAVGLIPPELNREFRSTYGDSIPVKEAEEEIRKLEERTADRDRTAAM